MTITHFSPDFGALEFDLCMTQNYGFSRHADFVYVLDNIGPEPQDHAAGAA